jgi:hypothetical protein
MAQEPRFLMVSAGSYCSLGRASGLVHGAESAPTGVASGKTGVRAIAVIHCERGVRFTGLGLNRSRGSSGERRWERAMG